MSGQGKNWRKRKRKKNIFLNNEIVLMLNWENYSQGQWSNGANLEAAAKEKSSKKLFLYRDIRNSCQTNTVRPHIIAGSWEGSSEKVESWGENEKA